jgi:hypothetical protein
MKLLSFMNRRVVSRLAASVGVLVIAAGIVAATVPSADAASAAGARASAPKVIVFYYHFMDYNSDLSLAIDRGSTRNGAGAVQWTYIQQAKDQIWSATLQNPQHYNIFENLDRKCLGISGASKARGARAVAWTCDGHADQQWKVITVHQFPNVYEFKNRNSGLCLGISRASKARGAAVIQWPCNGHPDQHWFPQR